MKVTLKLGTNQSLKIEEYNGRIIVYLDNFQIAQSTMFYLASFLEPVDKHMDELKAAEKKMKAQVCTLLLVFQC